MLEEKGVAMIGETPGELLAETPDPAHFPQQERATLAGQTGKWCGPDSPRHWESIGCGRGQAWDRE
jgi:hypothetical protein